MCERGGGVVSVPGRGIFVQRGLSQRGRFLSWGSQSRREGVSVYVEVSVTKPPPPPPPPLWTLPLRNFVCGMVTAAIICEKKSYDHFCIQAAMSPSAPRQPQSVGKNDTGFCVPKFNLMTARTARVIKMCALLLLLEF